MNFFSELLSDYDKKFNNDDKNLINRIVEGIFKSDQEIKLLKQEEQKGLRGDNFNERIWQRFKKGEKKFSIEYLKISESRKKYFPHTDEMGGDYCHFYNCETHHDLKKKVNKIVGIVINVYTGTSMDGNSVGVGSSSDDRNYIKLYDQAIKKDLQIIIDWIIKEIKK